MKTTAIIIRLAIAFIVVAFGVLFIATLLQHAHLISIARPLILLGISSLFSGFILLLALGSIKGGALIIRALSHYFSKPNRALRKLYWTQNNKQHCLHILSEQRRYIHYSSQIKRQYLLKRDNQKQNNALAKSLSRQLIANKKNLSKAQYTQLKKQLKCHQRAQNGVGLLELAQKLTDIHRQAL